MTIPLKAKGGKPSKRPPVEELAELYSKMTAKEVAAHYGVAESTVKTWIAYYRKQEATKHED